MVRKATIAKLISTVTVLPLTLALAACGGGSTSSTSSAGLTTVHMAFQSTSSFYVAKLAQSLGYFKAQGLNVQFTAVTSGSQQTSLLLNNQIQIGGSGPAEILTPMSKGVPLQMLPVGTTISTDPATSTRAIVVPQNSPLTSCADLAGKQVAVSNLLNSPHIDAMGAVDADGGNSSAVHWVAIPGGQQWSSVQSNKVAAAAMKEPDLTQALMAGGKILCLPEKDSGSTLGFLFFTTKTYASRNASTLSKLDAALAKANDYANAHPAALQQQEATDAELNATVQAKLRVETYANDITSADLQPMMTLLLKYKVITTAVDLSTALFTNAS